MQRRQLLLWALAPLAACTRRRERTSARVLAMPYIFMSPLFLAHEQNYFADEGLDVEVLTNTASMTAIPLLAGGEADAAFYSINPSFLNAVARGARVRIVAGRQYNAPECASERRLIGSRTAFPDGFTDFRQLKGKRIAMTRLASPTAFNMDACLAKGGLTRDDIKIVVMEDNLAAAGLKADTVDVLVSTSEEIHLSHLRDHIVLGPSVVDAIPGYVYSYIVFGRRFLDGDVAVGGRFLRAYLRGASDFVAGKNPQFLLDFIRSNGLDPDTPDRLCRQTTALDGRVPLEDIQRFADWAVLRELCQGPVKAEDLVDLRFIEWLRRGKIS